MLNRDTHCEIVERSSGTVVCNWIPCRNGNILAVPEEYGYFSGTHHVRLMSNRPQPTEITMTTSPLKKITKDNAPTSFDLNRLKELREEMIGLMQKFPVGKPSTGTTYYVVQQGINNGVFTVLAYTAGNGYMPERAFLSQEKAREFADMLNVYLKEISRD